MDIEEKHKELLRKLGLREQDFEHFDGTFVSYEYSADRGVRLYDPYYTTSYDEYIGIDGWSAWSSEQDTFMSDILKKGIPRKEEKPMSRNDQDKMKEVLRKKFGTEEDDTGG